VHDPEKWNPVFRKDHAPLKMHDPEKWNPVFRKDHAPLKMHDPEKPVPDPIGDGIRFSEKIMHH
jgi:hypothetical protein